MCSVAELSAHSLCFPGADSVKFGYFTYYLHIGILIANFGNFVKAAAVYIFERVLTEHIQCRHYP